MVRQVLNGSALDHWPAANHGAGWPNFNRVHYFFSGNSLGRLRSPVGLSRSSRQPNRFGCRTDVDLGFDRPGSRAGRGARSDFFF